MKDCSIKLVVNFMLPEVTVRGQCAPTRDRDLGGVGLSCNSSVAETVAIPESLSDLLVNMHEKLMCKDSVESKCFDEEDWNNKKGGVRKWDKYTTILDYSANTASIRVHLFLNACSFSSLHILSMAEATRRRASSSLT